jgi:hypothetical protein
MVFLNTKTTERVKTGFDLLPKGIYQVLVSNLEEKPSQAGGAYIEARFDVVEGPHKGRKLWHRFTTRNKSEQALAIGKSQLASFIEACGYVGEVTDEKHFFSICMDQVLLLDVGIGKNKITKEDEQKVYDFLPVKPKAAASAADEIPPPGVDDIPF